MAKQTQSPEVVIEPSMGATYSPRYPGECAAYQYGTYTSGVLKGRQSRQWLDSGTVAELKAKYPHATVANGSGYVEDTLMDLPGDDDPDYSDVDLGDDDY